VSEIAGVGLLFPLVGFPVSALILTHFALGHFACSISVPLVLPLSMAFVCALRPSEVFCSFEKRKLRQSLNSPRLFLLPFVVLLPLNSVRMSRSLVFSVASFCQRRPISPVCFSPLTSMSSTVLYF